MEFFSHIFMVFYLLLVSVLAMYGLHRYWILFLYYRHYKWAPALKEPAMTGEFPRVTVQLPLFNERYVASRLIDSVCRLDYPRHRLQIQVLDDSTDITRDIVASEVAKKREEGFDIVHRHRLDRSGFKAGALGQGLQDATGEFVAIFDADFLPPADFLKRTVPHFANAAIGMVQTRWGHLNEDHSLLTTVQSIFLDGHFLLEHTARNRSGAFFNFNGTAGIWRREAIDSSGGWQADTLTEDLDLSYRAQMRGWKFIFLPDVVCPAELPVDIASFKTQQNRWTMGAIQTARKMLPTIWRSSLPLKVKVEATFHLTGCVGYVLMALLSFCLPFSVILRTHQDWPLTGWVEGLALAATTLSVGLFYGVCLKELYPDWSSRLRHVPMMVSMGVGMCFSNSRAIWQGLGRRQHEFRRTPKFSVREKDRSWKKKTYLTSSRKSGWLELVFAVYFVGAFTLAIQLEQWVSLPFIALFGFGYVYVAFLSFSNVLAALWPQPWGRAWE